MGNALFAVLGSSCLAWLLVNVLRLHVPVKRAIWGSGFDKDTGLPVHHLKRLKPLDCDLCLSWWIGLLSGAYLQKNLLEAIYIGAVSAVLSIVINKILNK